MGNETTETPCAPRTQEPDDRTASRPTAESDAIDCGPCAAGATLLTLASIVADERVQVRAAIADEVVEEYAEAMGDGVEFPPLTIYSDGNTHRLADGFHRHAAALLAGRADFLCEVRQGGLREAILFAAGANASHGRQRSNEDKRAAVQMLLSDDEWSSWSDREIARHCHVSHQLVAEVRRATGRATSERSYRNKHGEVGKMSIDRIGKASPSQDNAIQQPVPAVASQTAVPSPAVAVVQPSPEVPQLGAAAAQPDVSSASSQNNQAPDGSQGKSEGSLTEKQAKAGRRAAQMARKKEDDRFYAENEDLLRDIANIIFEAPEEKRLLVIEKIDRVGLTVSITDLALVMRDIRPELFLWKDASGAEDAA